MPVSWQNDIHVVGLQIRASAVAQLKSGGKDAAAVAAAKDILRECDAVRDTLGKGHPRIVVQDGRTGESVWRIGN